MVTDGKLLNTYDFWRDSNSQLPNGVVDSSELTYHAGVVGMGVANANANPSFYPAILSYASSNTVKTQLIRTAIPNTLNVMLNLRLKGYAYGNSKTIDVLLGAYITPAQFYNTSVTTMGTEVVESVRFGVDAGVVVVEINWRGTGIYYNRYQVDAYVNAPDPTPPSRFVGWTITEAGMPAAATGIVTPVVYGSAYPLYYNVVMTPNTPSLAIGVDANGLVKLTNTIGVVDNRTTNASPASYPVGVTYEFKENSVIGISTAASAGNLYAELETHKRWPDTSEGLGVYQKASIRVNGQRRVLVRMQTSATAWGAWAITAESSPAALPQYASLAAANADAGLLAGSAFRLTGDKTIRSK